MRRTRAVMQMRFPVLMNSAITRAHGRQYRGAICLTAAPLKQSCKNARRFVCKSTQLRYRAAKLFSTVDDFHIRKIRFLCNKRNGVKMKEANIF